MVNILRKLIPNLTKVTAPLWALLEMNAFNLQKTQFEAIGMLKTLVASAPILKIFDPNLSTGLRIKFWRIRSTPQTKPYVMRKPKVPSSRIFLSSLTWLRETICPNWKRNSRVGRFHEYLCGRKFTINNDHQPLKSIYSKSIVTCAPRIQKLFLQLQK